MTIFLLALLAIAAPPALIVLAVARDLLWIQHRHEATAERRPDDPR